MYRQADKDNSKIGGHTTEQEICMIKIKFSKCAQCNSLSFKSRLTLEEIYGPIIKSLHYQWPQAPHVQ